MINEIMKINNNIAKVWATNLEESAKDQIYNVLRLPFIHSHVAVMADAHFGMGATIGSVIATKGTIIPSAIGVECKKDSGVVDEIPSAYKDIDEVMNNQSDLAEKVYELKQLICIKG